MLQNLEEKTMDKQFTKLLVTKISEIFIDALQKLL